MLIYYYTSQSCHLISFFCWFMYINLHFFKEFGILDKMQLKLKLLLNHEIIKKYVDSVAVIG